LPKSILEYHILVNRDRNLLPKLVNSPLPFFFFEENVNFESRKFERDGCYCKSIRGTITISLVLHQKKKKKRRRREEALQHENLL
jgi:hypothetical protein